MQNSDLQKNPSQHAFLHYTEAISVEGASDTVQAFEYSVESTSEDFFLQLTDVLCDLPSGIKLRAVMRASPSEQAKCWLLVQGASTDYLKGLGTLLNLTRTEARSMSSEIDHLITDEVSVVRIREGRSVTEPGMTRCLTRWLTQQGHITCVICDLITQKGGLASLELTYVFGGCRSVSKAFNTHVSQRIDAEAVTYSPNKANQFLTRIKNHLWGRPRALVTVGNAADLWPSFF